MNRRVLQTSRILLGHPKQFGDNLQAKPPGKTGHNIDRSLDQRRSTAFRLCRDPGPHVADAAPRERLVYQFAQATVFGVTHPQHILEHGAQCRRGPEWHGCKALLSGACRFSRQEEPILALCDLGRCRVGGRNKNPADERKLDRNK